MNQSPCVWNIYGINMETADSSHWNLQTTFSNTVSWMKIAVCYQNFAEVYTLWLNWLWVIIGSGKHSAPNRRQAITWTNVSHMSFMTLYVVTRPHYVSGLQNQTLGFMAMVMRTRRLLKETGYSTAVPVPLVFVAIHVLLYPSPNT